MPALSIYQIRFPSGLHIGTRGVDLDEAGISIPSDTLFSALVDAWSRRGGDVAAFIQPFLQPDLAGTGEHKFEPPFLLSSAFPFVGGVRFFPMPVAPTRLFSPALAATRVDDINGIHFISQGLLDLALQGKVLDEYLFPESERALPEKGMALQHGELWLTRKEAESLRPIFDLTRGTQDELRALRYRRIWSIGQVPRVTVDRVSQASTIFHIGRVSFTRGCGLWFGIYWRNVEASLGEVPYRQIVDDCFQMLSDDGLGGERSTGYGTFEFAGEEPDTAWDVELPHDGELCYLLSRYSPWGDPQSLTDPACAYRLLAVSGWFRRPGIAAQRRKRLMLVGEGSLIKPSRHPAGRVWNVAPEFMNDEPVYRSGLGLAIRWPGKEA